MLDVFSDVVLDWSRVWEVEVIPDQIQEVPEVPQLFVYHLTRLAQYAADILPLAMLRRCRALKLARFLRIRSPSPFFGLPAVLAPCSPKRIVLILLPTLATTMWDFLGWLGVRLGLL